MWKWLFGEDKLIGLTKEITYTVTDWRGNVENHVGIWHFFENTKTKKRSAKLIINAPGADSYVSPHVQTWIASGDRTRIHNVEWLD